MGLPTEMSTERSESTAILHAQNKILEEIARGRPLQEILD